MSGIAHRTCAPRNVPLKNASGSWACSSIGSCSSSSAICVNTLAQCSLDASVKRQKHFDGSGCATVTAAAIASLVLVNASSWTALQPASARVIPAAMRFVRRFFVASASCSRFWSGAITVAYSGIRPRIQFEAARNCCMSATVSGFDISSNDRTKSGFTLTPFSDIW